MKKRIVIRSIVLCLAICLVFGGNLYASSDSFLGYLNWWEASGESSICRWASSSVSVKIVLLKSGFTYFKNGMPRAATQWDDSDATGLTITVSETASSPKITFYGGTYSQVHEYVPGVLSSSNSYTDVSNRRSEGFWMYNSVRKTQYKLISVTGCVVYNNHTQSQVYKTCLHEMGHAMGYIGHSPYLNDVMYATTSTTTTLTSRDKRHLNQVYY